MALHIIWFGTKFYVRVLEKGYKGLYESGSKYLIFCFNFL